MKDLVHNIRFIRRFRGMGVGKVFTLSHVLGVVEGEESLLQVFVVAVAVGSLLKGADFVVMPSGGRSRAGD